MTIRQLRAWLFTIDNQALTVAQLRAILFDAQDQDTAITDETIQKIISEK